MRYRIISITRPYIDGSGELILYQAEMLVLGLFWFECDPDPSYFGESCSSDMEEVEKFIEARVMNKRRIVKYVGKPTRNVVKVLNYQEAK